MLVIKRAPPHHPTKQKVTEVVSAVECLVWYHYTTAEYFLDSRESNPGL